MSPRYFAIAGRLNRGEQGVMGDGTGKNSDIFGTMNCEKNPLPPQKINLEGDNHLGQEV